MGEEANTPAGIGRLYFTTADDKNLEHLTPLDGHIVSSGDLHTVNGWKKEKDGQESKGWTIQGTVRVDADSKDIKRLHKLLTEGKGRLPRKEKKRRINRIARNKLTLACLKYYCFCTKIRHIDELHALISSMLFPDHVHLDTDTGSVNVCLNMAQLRLVNLFMHRLEKNMMKWLSR